MGSKNSPPPAPDYSGIANASAQSAQYAYQLGKDQLQWAKDQYASDKAVTDKVVNQALETNKVNNENAAKDRARYESIYQPLENQLASDAQSYASPERQQLESGRAVANVAQQYDAARTNSQHQLESFGIDPSSTRYGALDIGIRAQQAAASAAAGNQARLQTEATGRALRSEAINVGRGYPGQIAGTYGTGLQAGAQAVNSGLATTASGASTMGTAPQWQGLGNSALNTWGNTLNMGFNNQMSAYNAQNQQSSGVGSVLGLLGGLAFEEGGYVPPDASPSHGVEVDDVPAALESGHPARLNAGEYVIPADVVQYMGQSHFQKLIDKARSHIDNGGRAPQKQQRQGVPA